MRRRTVVLDDDIDEMVRRKLTEMIKMGVKRASYSRALNQLIRELLRGER